MSCLATLVSVASAFPENSYSQKDVERILGVENEVVKRLLAAPHIATRRLMLPVEPSEQTPMKTESVSDLHKRFQQGIYSFGLEAALKALKQSSVAPSEVDVVVTVTSTGLPLPGISAILMKEIGLNKKAHRADIVGMGCNAGLSGMRTLSQMLSGKPKGTVGLLLCVEVCSALYKRDNSTGTGIVNSLFGDAAVAAVLVAGSPAADSNLRTPNFFAGDSSIEGLTPSESSFTALSPVNMGANFTEANQNTTPPTSDTLVHPTPTVMLVDFESHTFTDFFEDMRYEVDDDVSEQFYSFKLSKRIPQAVGDAVAGPVLELLERWQKTPQSIQHWVVHSGGAAVMDGVVKNLNLPEESIRHTRSVLRDFGNISSASFLVSYERLLEEHVASVRAQTEARGENGATASVVMQKGDSVVFIAMGPGTTIEVALGFLH